MSGPDKKQNREKCHLHQAQCLEVWCTRDSCIYWRLLEPQEVGISIKKGCGLQHFGVLDDLSPEMAAWLLTMKKRLENMTPESAKARITFRRREE